MINKGLYSSASAEWETPQELFDKLNKEFHFTLDVCAAKHNRKCSVYYTKEDDGLNQVWFGTSWMNPPYGRDIGKWIEKAYNTAYCGLGTVVCLLPARTDTKWWHKYIMKATEIRFIKGRLKFGNSKSSAPFPSVIVIFKNRCVGNTPKVMSYERGGQ